MAARALPDYLIAAGRYTFTAEEAVSITGWKEARSGLSRLIKTGKLFSPHKGFYVVIPPEYRSWGAVPAEWFIDPLMKHLKVQYYVGLLSAAAMHGAAHQAPQVFQVMTSRQMRPRDIRRVRLRFFYSDRISTTPVVQMTVHTGSVRVSSREATLFDLVAHPTAAVGFGNIATIIRDFGELDADMLAAVATARPRAHSRRVGWLLATFSSGTALEPLRAVAAPNDGHPPPLDSRAPKLGPIDPDWGLIINTEVEPDN